MSMYRSGNPSKDEQTATPEKYPQGYFKAKKCKHPDCLCKFTPKAPSEMYCSEQCRHNATTNAYLLRTYGITLNQYNFIRVCQDDKCAICGGEGFIMNPDRHVLKLVVDHDHSTGKVRGLLCHNCNRALGLLQDSKESLRKAIGYLEGATTIP